jgi:hypothetical protein
MTFSVAPLYKGEWTDAVAANSRYYPDIFLKGLTTSVRIDGVSTEIGTMNLRVTSLRVYRYGNPLRGKGKNEKVEK